MSSGEHKTYEDPTNSVFCVFDDHSKSLEAKAELSAHAPQDEDIQILQGCSDAAEVDASAKWFADTDKFMKKFRRELRDGQTILSVAVTDAESREQIHGILKKHDGRYITHFGEWITEVLK